MSDIVKVAFIQAIATVICAALVAWDNRRVLRAYILPKLPPIPTNPKSDIGIPKID